MKFSNRSMLEGKIGGIFSILLMNGKDLNRAIDLKNFLEKSGYSKGQTIVLLACHTGYTERSIGAELAALMKTLVIAPSGYAIYAGNGVTSTEVWNVFGPAGNILKTAPGNRALYAR